MIDPTNTVFHAKDIVFVFFALFNVVFYKPNFSFLPIIVLPFIAIVASYISSQVYAVHMDYTFMFGQTKSFLFLVLLLWMPYYDVIRTAKIASLILGILITCLFIAMRLFEPFEALLYAFVCSHNDMALMSHRTFLGVEFYGMYYKSIICMILPLFVCCHDAFVGRKHVFYNTVCTVFIMMSFLVSGSRATMLLPFTVVGITIYLALKDSKYGKYFMYAALFLGAIAFLVLLSRLASEKTEWSNIVKYGHLTSFRELFMDHPEYLIFGQGVGAYFYTIGFREFVTQTEWSYIELVRMCGIFCSLILVVIFYPYKVLLRAKKTTMVVGMTFAYTVYAIVTGTNPLFISSTGMMIMLMIYSYIYALEKEAKETTSISTTNTNGK